MTEQFTPYPIPAMEWREHPLEERLDAKILERLGAIEDRLSKIEALLSRQQPNE